MESKRLSEKFHILKQYIINNWDDKSNFSERLANAKEVVKYIDFSKDENFIRQTDKKILTSKV